MPLSLIPMHVNHIQFSEIIKYKKILWQIYIKNINAICVIVQDWTKSKNTIIFYTVNYITPKLTNSIHFMVFCKNFIDYKKLAKKTEEGLKVYDNLPIYLLGGTVQNGLRFGEMDTYYVVEQFANNGIRQFIAITTYNSNIWRLLSLEDVRKNNWNVRKHFAILCITLKKYFVKNKITTNKASQVFNCLRFNKHIAQFF